MPAKRIKKTPPTQPSTLAEKSAKKKGQPMKSVPPRPKSTKSEAAEDDRDDETMESEVEDNDMRAVEDKAAKPTGTKVKAAKAAATEAAAAKAAQASGAEAAAAKAAKASAAEAAATKAAKASAAEAAAAKAAKVAEAEAAKAAAAIAAAAAAAAAAAQATKTPSFVRELTEDASLQQLLNVGGAAGADSGSGSGSRRPAPRLVLVCFSANWCRPCQVFAPKLELMARRYRRVTFVKLNVDKLPDVADTYKVRAVPTFMLFRNGTQLGSVAAASQPRIELLLANSGAVPIEEDGILDQPLPPESAAAKKASGAELLKTEK